MQEIYVFEEVDFLTYLNVEQCLQKMKGILEGIDEI